MSTCKKAPSSAKPKSAAGPKKATHSSGKAPSPPPSPPKVPCPRPKPRNKTVQDDVESSAASPAPSSKSRAKSSTPTTSSRSMTPGHSPIQKHSAAIVEEEEGESHQSDQPPPKCLRSGSLATPLIDLDEEEKSLVCSFKSAAAPSPVPQEEEEEEASLMDSAAATAPSQPSGGEEEEEEEAEEEGEQKLKGNVVDFDDDFYSGSDGEEDKKRKKKKDRKEQKGRKSNKGATEGGGGKRPTVTKSNFEGASLRLACLGHTHFCIFISTEDAFPDVETNRVTVCKEALSRAAATSPGLQAEWDKVRKDEVLKETMILYVWKGAAQMRGEVKSKTDELMDKYNIPGLIREGGIKARVKWLLGEGKRHFAFGEITFDDAGGGAVNTLLSLSHDAILTTLHKQWFNTIKSEGFRYIKKFKTLPIPLLALILTCLEVSLKQWEGGKLVKENFSDIKWRKKYYGHITYITALQDHVPTWIASYQEKVICQVCSITGVDIDNMEEEVDLSILDFAALAAAA
ncbi:hypothetical protein JAAARDRAFT_196891 [Jaapia argillacea MUCL 33604]|uniref:DUF6532 domain-containing protein n=1 Tax=Jaapia argillacea MUCL 33604 TaxID=933084 RepID=A0A067PH71_9AGAM|nr:hypothetical protein JAAARDRAFT_196891 [Jaapia argillacea MUCL 33604]